MVVDFDDFGANHIISDTCQSHDCRDKLDQLHFANPNFKVTLFAIPAEMTYELAEWCKANSSWIELAVHGIKHSDNYECSEMTFEEFDQKIKDLQPMLDRYFVKGFKAPGWQISDGIFDWLVVNGWWVSDQSYNDGRRPLVLPAYKHVGDGKFRAYTPLEGGSVDYATEAWHGHTWDCVGNGIYETYDAVEALIRPVEEFKFVSEVLKND